MIRSSLYLCILYILLVSGVSKSQRWGGSNQIDSKGRSNRGYYGDKPYEQMQAEAAKEKKNTKPSVKQSSSGYGLSAWAIIGIVLTIILGGMAAYYVALFYPILCKKERKYDVIELDAV